MSEVIVCRLITPGIDGRQCDFSAARRFNGYHRRGSTGRVVDPSSIDACSLGCAEKPPPPTTVFQRYVSRLMAVKMGIPRNPHTNRAALCTYLFNNNFCSTGDCCFICLCLIIVPLIHVKITCLICLYCYSIVVSFLT